MTIRPMDIVRGGRPDSEIESIGLSRFRFAKTLPRIVCADGFSLSVQVGEYLYSTPRDDHGPWSVVEVGFPSERPEPWEAWAEYCEEPENPTGTVYAYVPVALVEALIALHGGES